MLKHVSPDRHHPQPVSKIESRSLSRSRTSASKEAPSAASRLRTATCVCIPNQATLKEFKLNVMKICLTWANVASLYLLLNRLFRFIIGILSDSTAATSHQIKYFNQSHGISWHDYESISQQQTTPRNFLATALMVIAPAHHVASFLKNQRLQHFYLNTEITVYNKTDSWIRKPAQICPVNPYGQPFLNTRLKNQIKMLKVQQNHKQKMPQNVGISNAGQLHTQTKFWEVVTKILGASQSEVWGSWEAEVAFTPPRA